MRNISEEFQAALCSGVLKCVTDAVKDRSNNLILCLRDGYVNVYYKSHSLFKITQNGKGYKLEFDFGHARYTSTMECAKGQLLKIFPAVRFRSSKNAWFYAETVGENDWITIINAYKSYIDDFFDPAKTMDYFKNSPSEKRGLLEKVRQQEIFSAYMAPTGTGEELVFYDLELSIPNETQAQRKKGSPDCLAVKLKDGVVSEIVLVEVKSTAAACTGSHGIKKHWDDFRAILCNPDPADKAFLYGSMRSSLECFHKLGMYPNVKGFCSEEDCGFSIKFFFTDGAIDWTKNSRQQNENYKCWKRLLPENQCYWTK